MRREAWRDKAACKDISPDIFFPERSISPEATAAKQICMACPVRLECLAWVTEYERPKDYETTGTTEGTYRNRKLYSGIYGGMTRQERWAQQFPAEAAAAREHEAAAARAAHAAKQKYRAGMTPEQLEAEKLRKQESDWQRRGQYRAA